MKYKRGFLDIEKNLIFYRYQGVKEIWMSPEKYGQRIKKDKEIAEKRKKLFASRESRKVGEVDENTGLVFWRYNKSCKNGEWWVTKEHYELLKVSSNKSAKNWQRKNPEARKESSEKWRNENK